MFVYVCVQSRPDLISDVIGCIEACGYQGAHVSVQILLGNNSVDNKRVLMFEGDGCREVEKVKRK